MYQLYFYAPYSSWSFRPWILLKTLDIPFVERQLPFEDKAELHRQLAQHSPTAKVPVLQQDEQKIWDSLAIIEYIAEDYPQVWAENKIARAWSRSACAEMHSGFPALREICSFAPKNNTPLAAIPEELVKELQRLNQLGKEGLTRFQGNYLAGSQFTAVDAFFAPVVGRIETYGLQRYLDPENLAYFQRIKSLPSYQAWLDK